ncbi:enoyl-CoA hydratase/isomerase family protein [Ilumatobacter coccineus]|uniref:Putative enoyl-CoA hydratase n=1 Tax=Ilumatobacter coccineus (strain NBRC 103263 / KCTC 29153 / YM16-304) TaxID=1313172 RepID=A0A6C7E725_ILUCY|nr:enoyl-CoA hydratase [Ilumatobacter coccineus]BAN02193.1 putative enoyl-CoA hydratase [Ilumatobacter coccineus YM16-304]
MASDTYETIIVDRSEGIVTITLNRPHRKNAADAVMWSELLTAFREVASSTSDRVLVLTGADGDFCSGADVGGMDKKSDDAADSAEPPRHQLAAMRNITDIALALHRIPQPTIAKVRGVAVGAGLNMALACDMVVGDETSRYSEIFARRGLSIDFGGSFFLPRRVGMHKAKELALLADIIDAKEAEAIGLVNRIVPSSELDAFVDDWATRLAAGPPIALAMTKRLLGNSMNVTLEEALDDEGLSQTVNFGTKDTAEAVRAFLEKRSPNFRGQ